jgi:hypothetical protein
MMNIFLELIEHNDAQVCKDVQCFDQTECREAHASYSVSSHLRLNYRQKDW